MTVDCFLAKLTGSTFVGVCFSWSREFWFAGYKRKRDKLEKAFWKFFFFGALPEKVYTVELLVY